MSGIDRLDDTLHADPVLDYRNLLNTHEDVLKRSIDVEHGLWRHLVAEDVIENDDWEDIEAAAGNNATQKVIQLLKLLCRKNDIDAYERFLEVLRADYHEHVYNFLKQIEGDGVDRPLTKDEVRKFDKCSVELQKEVNAGGELLDRLVSKHCLSLQHTAAIENKGGEDLFSRADALLRILRRRGYNSLLNFAVALAETNQGHVAILLRGKMAFELKIDAGNKEIERKLAAMFEKVRRAAYQPSDIPLLSAEFLKILRDTLAVNEGSISLIVFCPDSKKLQSIIDYVTSSRMKQDIEKWIRRSYVDTKQIHVTVTVSEIHTELEPDRVCPREVLEQILVTAIVRCDWKRWKSTGLVTSQLYREIYTNLCSVCAEWAETLQNSRMRRHIQRHIHRHCYPYRCQVDRIQRVYTNEGVTGVTQLDDRLYVTVRDSDIIRVYDCSTPDYASLEPIQAKDLKNPWDLAACSVNHRIYITDCDVDRGGVFYVEIQSTQVSRRRTISELLQPLAVSAHDSSWPQVSSSLPSGFVHSATDVNLYRHQLEADRPTQGWLIKSGRIENSRGISVSPKSGHVIVVSWIVEGDSVIFVIDPFARVDKDPIIRKITLPEEVRIPHHAVETPDGQFVIGHGRSDETPHQVSLLSYDGKLVKSFGGKMLPSRAVSDSKVTSVEPIDDSPTEEKFLILGDEDVDSGDEPNYDEYQMLNTPYAVAIDYVEKPSSRSHPSEQLWTVIVTDYGGRRILVLDSELHLMRTLLTNEMDCIEEPRQVWIDSTSGRLYVGQDTGCVDVFLVRGRRKNFNQTLTGRYRCPEEVSTASQRLPPQFTSGSADSDDEGSP